MSSDKRSFSAEFLSFVKWPERTEIKTYKGACHCGKFTYEVNYPSLDEKRPVSCNCTFCTRIGTLNIFGPATMLRFDNTSAGRDELSSFESKQFPTSHHFCPGCGNYLFWEGKGIVGVNVRMFDDIKVESLSVIPADGRSRTLKK